MDTDLSTDLDETHVGGDGGRQAEQDTRGLFHRRNQVPLLRVLLLDRHFVILREPRFCI